MHGANARTSTGSPSDDMCSSKPTYVCPESNPEHGRVFTVAAPNLWISDFEDSDLPPFKKKKKKNLFMITFILYFFS